MRLKDLPASLQRCSTYFLRASLRAFSSLSLSLTGYASIPPIDRILSSVSLIWSALATVCCRKRLANNKMTHWRETYIVVPDENGEGDHDRFEWWKHIGRILRDIDSHPCRSICRLPGRLFGRSRFIECVIGGIGRRGSNSQGDGTRRSSERFRVLCPGVECCKLMFYVLDHGRWRVCRSRRRLFSKVMHRGRKDNKV